MIIGVGSRFPKTIAKAIPTPLPTGKAPSHAEIVLAFLLFIDERSVSYALLGDFDTLEPGFAGHVDIAVEMSCVERLPALVLRFCEIQHLKLIRIVRRGSSGFCFSIPWQSEPYGRLQLLHLDLGGVYGRKSSHWLDARELLDRRVIRKWSSGNERIYVAATDIRFVTYLLNIINKQTFEPRHVEFLRSQWVQDRQACRDQMRRIWRASSVELLSDAIERDPESIRHVLSVLACELRRNRRSSRQYMIEFSILIRRALRPTGYWMSFLGPDGSGKSYISSQVSRALSPIFDSVSCYHLRPYALGGGRPGAPVVDPHSRPTRGRTASAVKLLLWWLDCTIGFILKIFPRLVFSGLVIFDRHALDLVVDPVRYRYRGSTQFAEWLFKRMFRPAFFVVLDAPVEVLHQRKREVSASEAERQRQAYRELAERLPDAAVIDSSRGVDQVCSEVVDLVLDRIARRTALRFGLARDRSEVGDAP